MHTHGVRPVLQGLIKWSTAPSSLATWEDIEMLQLQQRFLLMLLLGGEKDEHETSPVDQRMGKRVRKPNKNVRGLN
jgi:hypothetical protein